MQLKDMPNFGILIVVTILVFGAAAVGLQSFKDSSGVYTVQNRINYSITSVNNTFTDFVAPNDEILGFTQLRNVSGSVMGAGNYTVVGGRINITSANQGNPYYVDYTIKGGSAFNMTKDGLLSVSNITSQFGTLGSIAGVLLVVLAILGLFMYKKFV